MTAPPLHQESALAQPPESKSFVWDIRLTDIGQECVVRQHRLDQHRPNSFLTMRTPSTIFFNFARAAQRAVWLRPQSGANARRSGGAYCKQRRTRDATSSGVSI